MSHNLNRMTFLSYQPLTLREDGDVKNIDECNYGQLRTEAILHRDEYFVEKLGYNPYWAVGGKTVKDVMLGSLFCAPNNAFVAHIFQTDEYIRLNKIDQELVANRCLKKYSLDFVDDSCSDVASEFLIKSMNEGGYRFAYYLPYLSSYNSHDFHVVNGFVMDNGFFKNLAKQFCDIWDDEVKRCCKFIHNYLHYDEEEFIRQANIKSGADVFIEARFTKIIFEVIILPVILECLSPDNVDDNGLCLRSSWIFPLCWTFKSYFRLYMTFATACNDETVNMDLYNRLVREGYDLIIDDQNVLNALSDDKKIYPNEFCPCGSGKKFKKCHGCVHFEETW